jgi:hypothetical protein
MYISSLQPFFKTFLAAVNIKRFTFEIRTEMFIGFHGKQ